MKYFHRTSLSPEAVLATAVTFFPRSLVPVEEGSRGRRLVGVLGELTVSVEAEGGHYTRVTVQTNQPGESELDRLAKRFLAVVHSGAEPSHRVRGAY